MTTITYVPLNATRGITEINQRCNRQFLEFFLSKIGYLMNKVISRFQLLNATTTTFDATYIIEQEYIKKILLNNTKIKWDINLNLHTNNSVYGTRNNDSLLT